MQTEIPAALGLSRRVLIWVRILNFVYGAGISLMLLLSLAVPQWLFEALGFKFEVWGERAIAARGMMAIGIAGAVIGHCILTTLIDMVDSVRAGDPFIMENAVRLQTTAWLLLAAEILHLVIGALIGFISTPDQPFDASWEFSLTPWIAILMLFVLARVFDQGARMREDLEGTV